MVGIFFDIILSANWKESQIMPIRNIFRKYVPRLWNFNEQGVIIWCVWRKKEVGWKETQWIQNIGVEDSQGNRKVEQSQVLKIWENYVTELYDRPNRPETLEVDLKRKKIQTRKAHIFCKVKWKKLSRKWGIRRLQEMMMYLEMCLNYLGKLVWK